MTHRQVLLRGAIPGNNLQGVRRDILDDKYQLDTVPGGDPMIYMSQQSQPKIVLFGGEMKLTKPCLVSAWEDRLIITADAETPRHRVYYRDYRTGKTYKQDVSDDLGDLIRFLTHKPTPEDPSPGLDMSYSEVVGALYAIHQQRGVICAFATEADKLQAQLLEAARAPTARVRPETAADREEMSLIEQPDTSAGASPARPAEPRRPRIIPITRPPESKGK